jgi:hypothetical protein
VRTAATTGHPSRLPGTRAPGIMASRSALRLGAAGCTGAAGVAAALRSDLSSWWPSGTVEPTQLPAVPRVEAVSSLAPTHIHITSGGTRSKWGLGVVGGAVLSFVLWKRWNGLSWQDVMYVTKASFDQGVGALEDSIQVTAVAVATAKELLQEKIAGLDTRIIETAQELELKIEGEVGLVRDDLSVLQGHQLETGAVVRELKDEMATGSQVAELSDLLVDTSRTARHTAVEVRQTHECVQEQGERLGAVAEDVRELKRLAAEQTIELRQWMQSQLEEALTAKLPGTGSGVATPPEEPAAFSSLLAMRHSQSKTKRGLGLRASAEGSAA